MPLPFDEKILKLSEDIIAQLQSIFGKHAGLRPVHAKGLILSGTFTPSAEAKTLSVAPHFNSPSTPIWVRFSSSTGIPQLPDTDPNGNPRGMGIRFHLGGRSHTDLIGHSTPFFPAQNGQEFLDLFKAIAASPPGTPSPSPVEKFLGAHPAALAFIQAPKPFPSSLAKEAYYGLTALKFVNAEGKSTYFRFHVVPSSGTDFLEEAAVKEKGPNYLYDELPKLVEEGPISFRLLAQLAEDGDEVNNVTVHWPESRPVVELGVMKLDAVVPDNAKEQKYVIFDPVPRIKGVEPSDDPLLELRAAVYLMSGRQRRAA